MGDAAGDAAHGGRGGGAFRDAVGDAWNQLCVALRAQADVVGAEDGRIVVRERYPIAARAVGQTIEPDAAFRLIALVGHEAARLRALTRRAPVDSAMFDAYAA